jgi:hypothetical protein
MSMYVTTTSDVQMSPEALAHALWRAEPEEFARFWFAFAELYGNDTKGGYERLCAFARDMTPRFGGVRKQPLKTLARLIDYYEVLESRTTPAGTCKDCEGQVE